jgi:hypothetical protein
MLGHGIGDDAAAARNTGCRREVEAENPSRECGGTHIMAEPAFLPELPDDFEKTRATLHAYARSVGAIPRAYADAHPKWWHVALDVVDRGLKTDPVPLPEGGTLQLLIDLISHEVVLTTSSAGEHRISMAAGLTGTEMAERLIGIAATYGLEGEYHREKFENDEARQYDPAAAAVFFGVLRNVRAVFEKHRSGLDGEVSPVHVWPHGFDLAFDWFGTRVEEYEENGETAQHQAQLNLGFYPGERAYFYSNPWPFEADVLLGRPLPHGAQWHTDGWEGTILYYDRLQGDPEAETKLQEYAAAVFDLAAPTLMA